MLSEDDLNIADMDAQELAAAWDLWFDLAQATNDDDPPYTHGVFVRLQWEDLQPRSEVPRSAAASERS
jgi:hypothetical protein